MKLILKRFLNKKSFHYHYAKNRLKSLYKQDADLDMLEATVSFLCKKTPKYAIQYKKAFFVLFKDIHKELAIEYGEDITNADTTDESLKKVLSVRKERLVREYYKSEKSKNKVKKIIDRFKISRQKFYVSDFEYSITESLGKKTEIEIKRYIENQLNTYPSKKINILKHTFRLLKDVYPVLALEYGDKVLSLEKETDLKYIQVLFTRANRINDIEKLGKYSKLLNNPLAGYYEIIHSEKQEFIKISEALQDGKSINIKKGLSHFLKKYDKNKDIIYFMFASLYYDYKKNMALDYAKKALESKETFFSYRKLFDFYMGKGLLYLAYSSMPNKVEDNNFQIKINVAKENYMSLKENIRLPISNTFDNEVLSSTALYLLYNSLPYHTGGYAIRSHGLIKGINDKKNNITIEGMTRLAYPNDIVKTIDFNTVPQTEIVDELTYHRLRGDIHKSNMSYITYIDKYALEIVERVQNSKPFVLHAASNFLNGLAAIFAAKQLGIKAIYEIRGLWEITSISNHPELLDSDIYNLHKKLETQAALYADKVITITEALKEEMIRRGVASEKIVVIPNGVDSAKFKPLERNIALQKTLNVKDKIVIGYLGSFVSYEGLNYLVDAVNILIHKGIKNISILMVGDGAVYQEIQDQVQKLNLSSYFIFTGRVSHQKINEYYSLVDIAPFPRKGVPVCEMVSPLKPFEAMAMEKAVIVSDVAALSEIIDDGKTGLVFKKDNIYDLADKLEILISNKQLCKSLGAEARKWIKEHREWHVLSQKLLDVYTELKRK